MSTKTKAAPTLGFVCRKGHILVRVTRAEEKTQGGLYKPQAAQERPGEGEVAAVPNETEFKVGDRVVFPPYAGVWLKVDGEDLLLLDDDHVKGWRV